MQLDSEAVSLDDARVLDKGWHALESNASGYQWRWSKPGVTFAAGARLIVLDLGGQALYWQELPAASLALSA
jgi:hypothetical protein